MTIRMTTSNIYVNLETEIASFPRYQLESECFGGALLIFTPAVDETSTHGRHKVNNMNDLQ
jgi:hypothetical protein